MQKRYEWLNRLHSLVIASGCVLLFIVGLSILFIKGAQLQKANRIITTFENILPVCSNCNKIRQESNEPGGEQIWINLEDYMIDKKGLQVSHGMCPDCIREFYPDLAEEILAEAKKRRKK